MNQWVVLGCHRSKLTRKLYLSRNSGHRICNPNRSRSVRVETAAQFCAVRKFKMCVGALHAVPVFAPANQEARLAAKPAQFTNEFGACAAKGANPFGGASTPTAC